MSDSELPTNSRVPTLVQLCQRVASSCVDSITTLGDDLSYPLVKPILERSSAEQLLELEESSPHLLDDTLEIWIQLCIRKFPTAVERYLDDDLLEPPSWRERYQILKLEEEQRFERLGSKLKAQRMEAEERKKEREVKLTDRVPPPKRPKTGWGSSVQPKTLIQKTLSEASRIQKAMYHSRMIPPMNSGKTYRVLPRSSSPFIAAPTSILPNRVSVNTVHKRAIFGSGCKAPPRATTTPITSPLSPTQSPSARNRPGSHPTSGSLPPPLTATSKHSGSPLANKSRTASSAPVDNRPMKPAVPVKKDPMASLFVPKHRAYSQRPV